VNEIRQAVKGTKVVIIVAGLGGGAGSGVSPVVAKLAYQMGIKVFLVVTMPFLHEGPVRRQQAKEALIKLRRYADSIKIIENESINKIQTDQVDLSEEFGKIDQMVKMEILGLIGGQIYSHNNTI
jgi:cell division protein FtsZ